MRARLRVLSIGALCLTAMAMGGCVTSKASRYESQLTARIKSDNAPFESVALAFGLGGSDGQVAVAAVRDN
ncbi:MAG: hypothetical protein L0Y44_13995 [Phycisphaerales bacterium]|nr:hypothetical protein [Phycisphaerales bacterium]MCI0631756.1 hypothetical protein [Phycisphaerales bacterium]MCI0675782.1 hypothetical protein [Phycisphaerales bacterium]